MSDAFTHDPGLLPSAPTAPGRAPHARVAVLGGGLAGCVAAQRLSRAGWGVTLFEKSRGLGGRMATRRLTADVAPGRALAVAFDHGAPAFSARGADFRQAVHEATTAGVLAAWSPRLAPGSYRDLDDTPRWVASPDMPAWCRRLVAPGDAGGDPVAVLTQHRVDALQRLDGGSRADGSGGTRPGWRVSGQGPSERPFTADFDAVLVTAPAPQAATLLAPHRADWAGRARRVPMQPTWTLMALAADESAHAGSEADVAAAWPTRGPLAWVIRQDARPQRLPLPGAVAWVAHATPAWSQTHLEADPATVQAALLDALASWTGPQRWLHSTVHRWRYATVERSAAQAPGQGWHDAALSLAVAGDWLGGGGVEGAWASGRAMADALVDSLPSGPSAGLSNA